MTQSNRPKKRYLALTLLFFSSLALGQVYSWVDENGKKHFGDKIPPQYQNQASEYDLKETNTSQATEVQKKSRVQQVDSNTSWYTDRDNRNSYNTSTRSTSSSSSSSCEAQKRAYEESKWCFESCRRQRGNVGNCGHCKQMKNPGFC